MSVENVVLKAEEMVKDYMSRFDSSHDFLHVDRVRRSGKYRLGICFCFDAVSLIWSGLV